MLSRGVFITLLGLAFAVTGCRDVNPLEAEGEEETDESRWHLANRDLAFDKVVVAPGGALFGYVADDSLRLMRSLDRGETWYAVLSAGSDWDALGRHVAFGSGWMYAPVLRSRDIGSSRHEILVLLSENRGENWHVSNQVLTARAVSGTAIGSDGTIFLGTQGGAAPGLFASGDGGLHWGVVAVQDSSGGPGVVSGTLATGPGGIVVVRLKDEERGEDGIYRPREGGQTWQALPAPGFDMSRIIITGDATMFATGTRDPAQDEYVFARSDNLGETWTQVTVEGLAGPILDLASDTEGRLYLAAGDQGVFWSADGGATWEAHYQGFPLRQFDVAEPVPGILVVDVLQVLPVPDGSLYANTTGGLYRLPAGWKD